MQKLLKKVPQLTRKWEKLMKKLSSRAFEYHVTTSCLQNSELNPTLRSVRCWEGIFNILVLWTIFLLVIHFGYYQKQGTGRDRQLVKPSIIFVLLLSRCSWWKLSSCCYLMVNLEYPSHLGTDPSFPELRAFDINSSTPFSQHSSAVYRIILL